MNLRVFISSTFLDLDEERQHLAKKVFPAIRHICRQYGMEFTEIDLRWGLTDEESRHGKVIRICLEEIDRCRPYFIGIIGDRYGWIPTFHELQRDQELLNKYPWVEDSIFEKKSLVEIEFDYAALRQPDKAEYAFFYSRKQQRRYQNTQDSSDLEYLGKLKDRIRESGLPLHEFSGPEMLGELIYSDLVGIIEHNWGSREKSSQIDQIRRENESFAVSRRNAYVADPHLIGTISQTVKENLSVIIYGGTGIGKSSLAAWWAAYYRQRHPADFISEHYVGVGSSGSHISILDQLYKEIRNFLNKDDEIPASPEERVNDLPIWLAKLSGKKAVIVIDGLDQLDEGSQTLSWLPEHLPEGVSVIATTRKDVIRAILTERGYFDLELKPLDRQLRETIIIRYLSEYHKSLNTHQLERLASNRNCENPLFLRTVLEELRISASFEGLNSLLEHYLSVRNLDELFQLVLERMEEDFGTRTVREVMGLLWASRQGLAERELSEIFPISRVRLASFLMALDYHILRRNTLLTFFHNHLRSAVETRYASGDERQKMLHLRIANYMRNQPESNRRFEEELWQFKEAVEYDELRNTLTDPSLFLRLTDDQHIYDTLSYWQILGGNTIMARSYRRMIDTNSGYSAQDQRKSYLSLAKLCSIAAVYDIAEESLRLAIAMGEEQHIGLLEIADSKEVLGDLLYKIGKYTDAQAVFDEAVECYNRHYNGFHIDCLGAMNGAGFMRALAGDLENAIKILEECRAHYELNNIINNDRVWVLNNLAHTYRRHRENEKATELIKEAYQIMRRIVGDDSPLIVVPMINLGMMFRIEQKYEQAHLLYDRALDVNIRYLGKDHPISGFIYNNKALAYFFQHQYELTLLYAMKALDIRRKIFGITHPDHIFTLRFLGEQTHIRFLRDAAIEYAGKILKDIEGDPVKNASEISTYKELIQSFSNVELQEETGTAESAPVSSI
jgi:tetratricopeptide (TPR) repeat protein